jgi:hypothetical protein
MAATSYTGTGILRVEGWGLRVEVRGLRVDGRGGFRIRVSVLGLWFSSSGCRGSGVPACVSSSAGGTVPPPAPSAPCPAPGPYLNPEPQSLPTHLSKKGPTHNTLPSLRRKTAGLIAPGRTPMLGLGFRV